LLDLAGADASAVVRANRVPNVKVEVWCDTASTAAIEAALIRVITDGLNEAVTVHPVPPAAAAA
jgi:hypothetical protein